MSMSDPIADMLTRIRNGQQAQKASVRNRRSVGRMVEGGDPIALPRRTDAPLGVRSARDERSRRDTRPTEWRRCSWASARRPSSSTWAATSA